MLGATKGCREESVAVAGVVSEALMQSLPVGRQECVASVQQPLGFPVLISPARLLWRHRFAAIRPTSRIREVKLGRPVSRTADLKPRGDSQCKESNRTGSRRSGLGAAFAQTNVTIYGVVDAGYVVSSGERAGANTKTPTTPVSIWVSGRVRVSASRARKVWATA